MLASFKRETEADPDNNSEFDANAHMNSLCEGGRIKLRPYNEFMYTKGWATLVEVLVLEIKKYPINLDLIMSDFGQLDVFFECYEKTQEVRVWRAINKAQNTSKSTCMYCGHSGMRRVRNDKLVVMCADCIRKAEDSGETGTWLDRY